ncbi:MAG: hypothetical protein ACLFP4_16090 [Spirochaetales bacterium]
MERDANAYFTVWWSPLFRLVKDTIIRRIPSEAGIFEIYRDEGEREPTLIGRARAYYGGLRNTLRGMIDESMPYPLNGELLDLSRKHYVRYALLGSYDDMDDVLFFFANRGVIDNEADDSGRYAMIYVKEGSLRPDGRPLKQTGEK